MEQAQIVRQRLPLAIIGVIVVSVLLIFRVVWFQFPQPPRVVAEFAVQREANAGSTEIIESARGRIYDRDGNPLAVNKIQYRVFISPNIVADPSETAADLARILGEDELDLYNLLRNSINPSEFLGVVNADTWREIRELNLQSIRMDRIQRRDYPQGALAAHVVGFVNGIGEAARGNYGVEGYYQPQLAGQVIEQEVSNIPFDLPEDFSESLESGADLVLTIDRDVQFLAESELQRAVTETGANSGSILIMNPRNGDILAMANYPAYDLNNYADVNNPRLLRNAAVSEVYEPGSVFKVLTVAAGLDSGAITLDWTYTDQGIYEVSGDQIYNWDRQAYGTVNTEQVLVNSLNVGAATISNTMGTDDFYSWLNRFGIASPTGVDLQGEEAGLMRTPTDLSGEWSESDLATHSFGQGLSVTPLQMLTAVNAIANDGLIMQPRIVYQRVIGDQILTSDPIVSRRAVSAETAGYVRDMMVNVVEGDVDQRARVPGYTIAGKTGTAEIPAAVGYEPDAYVMSFVGFLPADNPQVSILIKLDRPTSGRWASEVAAPVFSQLVSRLVILLEIPNDDIRLSLESEDVAVGEQQ
jgi:cell division protein FtsI (penicillin-binding protein 3)